MFSLAYAKIITYQITHIGKPECEGFQIQKLRKKALYTLTVLFLRLIVRRFTIS